MLKEPSPSAESEHECCIVGIAAAPVASTFILQCGAPHDVPTRRCHLDKLPYALICTMPSRYPRCAHPLQHTLARIIRRGNKESTLMPHSHCTPSVGG